jgi:hypothetical protein
MLTPSYDVAVLLERAIDQVRDNAFMIQVHDMFGVVFFFANRESGLHNAPKQLTVYPPTEQRRGGLSMFPS